VWKLAGFALSKEGSSENQLTEESNGTPGYRAPELMASEGGPAMYNNKVDIWGTGCILYELATGIRPFRSDWEVLSYRFSGKNMHVVLDDSFDTRSIATITKYIANMLQIDPSDRPDASSLSKEFGRQLQLAQDGVQETTGQETTVQETTVQETTVPDTKVPDTTVQETTVQGTTVPDTKVPDTKVQETTVQETTISHQGKFLMSRNSR
jgi:serine/threonine protein kinase